MTKKPLEAGSTVVSQCYKCKGPTGHSVVVMVEGRVAKVECKVCGGRHAFRPLKKGAPQTPSIKTGAARTGKKSVVTRQWEERTAGVAPSEARPYAMDEAFAAGETINHPTFGLGYVQRTIRPDKMEVLFRESLKVLRCRVADPA